MEKLISKKASLVLNYLKKNKCYIKFYWWCGFPKFKVIIEGECKDYPRISEETWAEIKSSLIKIKGEYQKEEIYSLKN